MKLYGAKNCSSRELLTRVVKLTSQLESLPNIRTGSEGKPYFPGHPNLHFSLSHSGDIVLCAVDRLPVGVDVERVVDRRDDLPAYALSEAEYTRFQLLGGDWPAFYSLWTKKEAWCKYTGKGLGKSFRETPPEDGLYYRAYIYEDYWATICGESEPPEGIRWLDDEES